MRIKITKSGIYNAKGEEILVGTELDVKSEPTGWAGRYETISGSSIGKAEVNNVGPKSVGEALALFTTEGVHVNTAKAQAKVFLGDKVKDDASKDDVLLALFDAATDTELKTFLGAKKVEVKDETRSQLIDLAKAA